MTVECAVQLGWGSELLLESNCNNTQQVERHDIRTMQQQQRQTSTNTTRTNTNTLAPLSTLHCLHPAINQQLLRSNGVDLSHSRRLLNSVHINTLRPTNIQPAPLPSHIATPIVHALTRSHITTSATHDNDNSNHSRGNALYHTNSLPPPTVINRCPLPPFLAVNIYTGTVLLHRRLTSSLFDRLPVCPPSTSAALGRCYIGPLLYYTLQLISRSSPRAAAPLVAMTCSSHLRR